MPNSQVFRMKAADNSPGAVLNFADRGHRFMVQFDSQRLGRSYHSPFADKSSADNVKWRSGSRGHRRTTADIRGQCPFFAFLCLFSAAFSNCFVFSHILSLQWSLQYHPRRSHGECILRDDQAADVPETSFLLLQKL